MAVTGFILSFLGIFLAFASIVMAYVAFFAPTVTAKFALRNRHRWLEIASKKDGHKFLRHELLSGFSIEIDYTNPVAEDFFEPWLDALYRPDKRASSYYVMVYFNGLPIMSELFVSYDGSRNFIPVPKMKKIGTRYYLHFDSVQRLLANVVGYVHIDDSIDHALEKILRSRFNPMQSEFDSSDERLSIKGLGKKIEEYKKKNKILNG